MIRTVTSSLDPPAAVLSLGTNDLVVDAPSASASSSTTLNEEELSLSNLGQVRCHPDQYLWNLRLPSADEMQRELEAAVVVPDLADHCSTRMILHASTTTSRDYTPLRRLADKLEPKNLLIVTGVLPGPLSTTSSTELLGKDIVHKLKFGMPLVPPPPKATTSGMDVAEEEEKAVGNPALLSASEQIGAGFIGLVDLHALNQEWPEGEREVREDLLLQSLGYASKESGGAPIFITTQDAFGREPFHEKWARKVFQYLIEYGADKTRIVFCRCPCRLDLENAYHALLTDGAHLSFSFHGNAFYPPSPPAQLFEEGHARFKTADSPSDEEGARLLSLLCKRGFASQLHLSHSITCRLKLQKYGGFGYTHLLLNVFPRFTRLEVSQCDLDRMKRGNLRELLAWWTPPPPKEKEVEMGTCSWCGKAFEMRENMYFTKFAFVYCRSRCLSKHGDTGWAPINK